MMKTPLLLSTMIERAERYFPENMSFHVHTPGFSGFRIVKLQNGHAGLPVRWKNSA
jgi:hypothetical protein